MFFSYFVLGKNKTVSSISLKTDDIGDARITVLQRQRITKIGVNEEQNLHSNRSLSIPNTGNLSLLVKL